MKFFIKKKFGQNFLIDHNIIKKIIENIIIKKKDTILEIGSGTGTLTSFIKKIKNLEIVEIDKDLIEILKKKLKEKNINFKNNNILNLEITNQKLRIIGNLPYNISIPIIFHLNKYKEKIKDIHIMLQKEVADNICAKPKSKKYCYISIIMQYNYKIKKLFEINSKSFIPKPKVDSTFIRMIPKKDIKIKDIKKFEKIIKLAFNKRRKIIKNSLFELINQNNIKKIQKTINKRPEELTIKEYINLYNKLYFQ